MDPDTPARRARRTERDIGGSARTAQRDTPMARSDLVSLARYDASLIDADGVIALQRTAGNQATTRLIAGLAHSRGDAPGPAVQRQPRRGSTRPARRPRFTPRGIKLEDVVKAMQGLGGPYTDLQGWTDTIKPGTFLGHAIETPGESVKGVRPEFQALLDLAKPKIDDEFKKSGNPVPRGYGIKGVGGFRTEISPHGAGVAIDIDAGDNPYIMHEGEQHRGETALSAELRPVYHRIAEFILNDPIDGEQSIIPKLIGSGENLPQGGRVSRRDRVAQYYDRLAKESDAMREYFRLMQDATALQANLDGAWKTVHPRATPPTADVVKKQMWDDYALLGGSIPRGGPPGIPDFTKPREAGRPFHPWGRGQKDPAAGFLTIPREVVVGLGQTVPRWGAIDFSVQSGDVMHFDDTNGLGKPFLDAKAPAAQNVDAENTAAREAFDKAQADAAKAEADAASAGSGATP